MNIENLSFKNIGAYGNKEQNIKFSKDGSLNLIVGKNGNGKCVHPDTQIEVFFKDYELEKKFIKFCEGRS